MQNISLIKQKIAQFLDFKGISRYSFYQKTGITRGVLDKDGGISEDNITKFIACFPEVNTEWLLTGVGNMIKQAKNVAYSTVDHLDGIPLVPFEAYAGSGDSSVSGVDLSTVENRYVVPLYNGVGVDFMITVHGTSMVPNFNSGDVVACKIITELPYVVWNNVYIFDTVNDGVMIKRLLPGEDESNYTCRSDNPEYKDFLLPKTDIRKIASVVGAVKLV